MATDENKKDFTPAEATLFFSVFKHNKAKAEIDWDKVADECNFKNASTAKVRFGQIKRKHWGGEPSSSCASIPSSPAKVKKATPRRGAKVKDKTVKPEPDAHGDKLKNEDEYDSELGLDCKDEVLDEAPYSSS